MRRDDDAQVHVIEAIIVGILVFVAIAIAAVFRVPTIGSTFEQSELERLGTDVLLHLAAAVPKVGADCNEPGKCPFESELERMVSLALRYQGPSIVGTHEARDISPLSDYFNQSLPDGARYVITYSNGVNATRIFPTSLTPPALDVVVAHTLITPNWTAYATQARTSALIQIQEVTGFTSDSTDTIHDPLNRIGDEWRLQTYKEQMSNAGGTGRIPIGAVYGTYRLCTPAPVSCSYFTVVPPGVYGAGSSILLSDRDNSTTLVPRALLFSVLKFSDTTNPASNLLDPGERLYLDFDGDNAVSVGDLRLSDYPDCQGAGTGTCVAGTYVKTLTPAQGDIGAAIEAFPVSHRPTVRAVTDGDAILEEGEFLYLDVPDPNDPDTNPYGDSVVNAGDRRLSRVATFRMGSQVASADFDVSRTLNPPANDFTATQIYFGDVDQDGVLDPEEPIYLDLVGNNQDVGIEALDLRLSPRGSSNLRYSYDVQAVIWFGI